MIIAYAQNFEDVMLNRLFHDKKTGFYIDVGAQHPYYDSVTNLFYRRGWSGINIEPSEEFFPLLERERPRDINLQFFLDKKVQSVEFFEVEGSGCSTADPSYAESMKAQGMFVHTRSVKTKTLSEVCAEHVQGPIDFLKVDVEGWEEQVLAGNDWELFRPQVILIEVTIPNSPKRRANNIREFLEDQGYVFAYFDGLNDFYLEGNSKALKEKLSVPPNVFDDFMGYRLADREAELIRLANTVDDIRSEIDRLKDSLAISRQEIRGADTRAANALAKVEAMRCSTSWRLTGPLRVLTRKIRGGLGK